MWGTLKKQNNLTYIGFFSVGWDFLFSIFFCMEKINTVLDWFDLPAFSISTEIEWNGWAYYLIAINCFKQIENSLRNRSIGKLPGARRRRGVSWGSPSEFWVVGCGSALKNPCPISDYENIEHLMRETEKLFPEKSRKTLGFEGNKINC